MALSGYVSKVDQPKSAAQENVEAVSLLATPMTIASTEYSGEAHAEQSGLDGVIMMNTPISESRRRAEGRRMDPDKGVMYHLEDNPPPEDPKDPKLKERLTMVNDEQGNVTRMHNINSQYEQSAPALAAWTDSFGLSNQDGKCEVQLGISVTPSDWKNKDAVRDAIFEQVDKIYAFKQTQFDQLREDLSKDLEEEKQRGDLESKASAAPSNSKLGGLATKDVSAAASAVKPETREMTAEKSQGGDM